MQCDESKPSDTNDLRFGVEITEEEMNERIEQGIPPNTRKSTKCAVNVFGWRNVRNETIVENRIPLLDLFDIDCTNQWLSQFSLKFESKMDSFTLLKLLEFSGILENVD